MVPRILEYNHGDQKNHHHTLQRILSGILDENFRIRVVWRRYPEKMSGYVNFGILGYARILGYQKRILGYGCGITLL